MPSGVNARTRLHTILEPRDGGLPRDQRRDLRRRGVARREVAADIPFYAPRVVPVAVGAGVPGGRCVTEGGEGTAFIYQPSLKNNLHIKRGGRGTYPRFTVMFLNGPLMHPPPLPAGFMPLVLCATFSPWPEMLVSLPSKMGDVSGLVAQRPQSQYCRLLSVGSEGGGFDGLRVGFRCSCIRFGGLARRRM